MKKTLLSLAAVMMSFTLSASAATTDCTLAAPATPITAPVSLPAFDRIVIEQTVTFQDGKMAVVYYKLEDGKVAVYSETNLSKYSLNDLLNVKESSERRVSATKGKCYGRYGVGAIRKIAGRILNG